MVKETKKSLEENITKATGTLTTGIKKIVENASKGAGGKAADGAAPKAAAAPPG